MSMLYTDMKILTNSFDNHYDAFIINRVYESLHNRKLARYRSES